MPPLPSSACSTLATALASARTSFRAFATRRRDIDLDDVAATVGTNHMSAKAIDATSMRSSDTNSTPNKTANTVAKANTTTTGFVAALTRPAIRRTEDEMIAVLHMGFL